MPPTTRPSRKLPPPIRPVARPAAPAAPIAPSGPAAPPPGRTRLGLAGLVALTALGMVLWPTGPGAQQGLMGLGNRAVGEGPVTFTADEVEYDQTTNMVTARGKVEAWQGDRVLRADEFTYDRDTGVATATGNVALIEPDGQTLFADRVELTDGMRDAAIEGIRGLLAANARVAAAGARRTGGTVTDLARVVYSSCDLCPEDPTRPPLWQLRARIATLDSVEQRVRYRDAAVQFGGVPLLYTPYFSHASPDAPRASGFLSPTFGQTRFLGGFAELPYYWAIDDHSDATISVTASTDQVPNLGGAYRRRFNSGEVTFEGSIGNLDGTDADGIGGHVFSQGRFTLDENWRVGFAVNRASSREYLQAWRYGAPRVLTTTAYAEGFWGAEGYARIDSMLYQGLDAANSTDLTPFVLPRGYADYVFPNDGLGGRFTVDASAFSLFRSSGTDTRRVATRTTYELPLIGGMGDIWTFRTHADLVGGWVDGLALAPTYGDAGGDGFFGRGHIRTALDWRMPFVRSAGEYGSQIIEPRVQVVTGPATGSQLRFPNEDSVDFEFTDANLFSLNRFYGRDRFEGGTRADAALRGAWLFPNGGQIEGLAGRSVRLATDETFADGSGLENRSSDWVGRLRLAPVTWLELLGRGRLDKDTGEGRLWDATATVFGGPFSLSGGYLLTNPAPNVTTRKREEFSLGGTFRLNEYWRVGLFGRYDIGLDRPVAAQASATYEDECFIFETRFVRSWAEDPSTRADYTGGTLLLFRVGLKTIGDFGLRAL
ncbi:LPS-assembly protein LptD [Falsiroseomonas frigidaquae]|nr:LPS assembly protein LptD [Falsiroseomonas frigidaquae]